MYCTVYPIGCYMVLFPLLDTLKDPPKERRALYTPFLVFIYLAPTIVSKSSKIWLLSRKFNGTE